MRGPTLHPTPSRPSRKRGGPLPAAPQSPSLTQSGRPRPGPAAHALCGGGPDARGSGTAAYS